MKALIKKCLIVLTLATSLITTVSVVSLYPISASAQWGHCRWVPAHWRNGHWVPAHRVCRGEYNRHCRWVHGHWRHGNWIPPHKVCW